MLQNIGIKDAWTWYALVKREWAKRTREKAFPHKMNATVLILFCLQNSNSDIQFLQVWLNQLRKSFSNQKICIFDEKTKS